MNERIEQGQIEKLQVNCKGYVNVHEKENSARIVVFYTKGDLYRSLVYCTLHVIS